MENERAMKQEAHSKIDDVALVQDLFQENGVLREKIRTALNTNEERTGQALREVIRFLFLVSLHNEVLTPSHQVDLAWHELILHTKAYHKFCEDHFGRYLHHTPGGGQEENQAQFQRTQELYQEYFGTPDPWFWGHNCLDISDESCGACETI